MRILLIGDYSSVHLNLNSALKNLKHDVTLASDGDGYKNYYRDVDLSSKFKNVILKNIDKIYIEKKFINNSVKGYDVVQFMSPFILSRFGDVVSLIKKVKNKNGKLFFLAAGDDYFYWKAFRENKFRYSTNTGTLMDFGRKKIPYETQRVKKINYVFLELCDKVISNAADYDIAYREVAGDKLKYIPFPITIDYSIQLEKENNIQIKILHGIQKNRIGFKGNEYFRKAIDKCKNSTLNQNFIYNEFESVPYQVYKKHLFETDILLDQVNSYSPGMNALEAMSYGKLVLGGFEEECARLNGVNDYKNYPLINVLPSVDDITTKLMAVLNDHYLLYEYKKKAIQYVRSNHCSLKIAEQYLAIWST